MAKVSTKLKVLPISPKGPRQSMKPKIPNLVKPLGASTGEDNPPMVPRNSQKGVKQRTPIDVPGVKTQ